MVTAHDETANFQQFQTFYVRPDIREVDETPDGMMAPEMLPDVVAKPLIDATQQNLIQRGYRPVDSKDDADLAVELTYLRAIYSASYCYDWYYWWDYAYWGYYYYYPYNSCDLAVWRSGMMVTHMTDLMSQAPVTPTPIATPPIATPPIAMPPTGAVLRPGIWFSGIYGVELDSASFVAARAIDGIDQSFEQSPYITSAAP